MIVVFLAHFVDDDKLSFSSSHSRILIHFLTSILRHGKRVGEKGQLESGGRVRIGTSCAFPPYFHFHLHAVATLVGTAKGVRAGLMMDLFLWV